MVYIHPITVNKYFAIFRYLLFSLIIILVLCSGLEFKVYLMILILTFMLMAVLCTVTGRLRIELILVKSLIVLCSGMLLYNIALLGRLSTVDIICFIIIELDAVVFLIKRCFNLN